MGDNFESRINQVSLMHSEWNQEFQITLSSKILEIRRQLFCHFVCTKVSYINCIPWLLSIACFLWRTVDIMLWHTFRFEEYMAGRYRVGGSLLLTCQYKHVFPFFVHTVVSNCDTQFLLLLFKCRILYFLYFIMVWVVIIFISFCAFWIRHVF